MGLVELLAPDLRVARLSEVDLEDLAARGIRGILVDLDNTITPWRSLEVAPDMTDWLARAQQRFGVCVTSNTTKRRRLELLRGKLGVPALGFMRKPFAGSFRRGMRELGTEAATTAMIGDQLFTDILGARRLGLYAILVRPVSSDEFIATKVMRAMERVALAALQRRGLLVEEVGLPHER